ncbi:hypothetical protein Patl1_04754 [Pistacia atlantica]|uniref:Uncharacterized protein n=1 Tax=Pistacia atlantica TaxID=434234 RepID=A0ACC1BQN8_9ROSI|nr:hypothetical protein Patl1_04754 [Pistacia atlantica]
MVSLKVQKPCPIFHYPFKDSLVLPRTKLNLKLRPFSQPSSQTLSSLILQHGPAITRPLGAKSIYFSVIDAATYALFLVPARKKAPDMNLEELCSHRLASVQYCVFTSGHRKDFQPSKKLYLKGLKRGFVGEVGFKEDGCFASHCGFGSLLESLLSDCQIVLIPFLSDQVLGTRLMVEELKVAIEVDRKVLDGTISKEYVSKAVKSVLMDKGSEVGNAVRSNHVKWKNIFSSK